MISEQLAERTLELCRIDSPIGHEQAIADFLERWAVSRFGSSRVFRCGHSLLVGRLDDRRPSVALVGHVDTVPPHPKPNPVRREGDRLYGLGSSDMKGGLAVMMALAETLPLSDLPQNLLLVFYEREEGPYLQSGLGPLFQQRPELAKTAFAIALEPTDNRVMVGCVGTLHATLRFSGRAAHSARPWQGENAIHKAGELLAELHRLVPRQVELDGFRYYEVMSATLARGGRARNVVPDSFELNLNYRFAPGKSLEQAQREVRDFVAGRAEIEFTDLAPSGRACLDNPFYRKLLAVTGLPAEAKQAWTDVGRLSQLGVDAVNFGPGETAQAHQEGESASVEALRLAYEHLAAFLSR